jgi:hypothetical protein
VLSQVRCPLAPIEIWSAALRPIPLRDEFLRGADSVQLRGVPVRRVALRRLAQGRLFDYARIEFLASLDGSLAALRSG